MSHKTCTPWHKQDAKHLFFSSQFIAKIIDCLDGFTRFNSHGLRGTTKKFQWKTKMAKPSVWKRGDVTLALLLYQNYNVTRSKQYAGIDLKMFKDSTRVQKILFFLFFPAGFFFLDDTTIGDVSVNMTKVVAYSQLDRFNKELRLKMCNYLSFMLLISKPQ